jgi:phosphatidylglycerophosphate synthase
MAIFGHIIGANAIRLWGIDSEERIKRQFRQVGVAGTSAEPAAMIADDTALLVNAAYLLENRSLQGLLRHRDCLLQCDTDDGYAAAHVGADRAGAIRDFLQNAADTPPDGVTLLRPATLDSYDAFLRKAEPPVVQPIREDNRGILENLLYGNAYKGITDLVTKWLWPRPAKVAVRVCADRGITPNMVTTVGLGLVIAASLLFYHGHYGAGLLAGWIMTFLDTVDGKLARVTVQSSKVGHVLDHGMDIIHPPFWYVLWGTSLSGFQPWLGMDRPELYGLIIVGYVGGRLIEALFHALGRCGIFSWRPFDAYFRLVTARRNPSLIILTTAVIVGRPDWGFIGVAAWTGLSTFIMAVRLLYAAAVRIREGPLESWLKDPATAQKRHAAAYRTFSATRGAYA